MSKIQKYCDFILSDSYDTTKGVIVAVENLKDYCFNQFVSGSKKYHLFGISNEGDLTNIEKPKNIDFSKFGKFSFTICPTEENLNFDNENIITNFKELVKHYFEKNDLDYDDDLKIELSNIRNLENNSFKRIKI